MDNFDMDHSSGSMDKNGLDDMGLNWSGVIQNERPQGNQVRFYYAGVPNEAKARELGYPYEDQVLHIEIKSRDNLDKLSRKPTEKDYQEYQAQYRLFKRTEEKIDGLALSSWPALNSVQVNNLRYAGIKTVEQLRDADTERLKKMGPEWAALQVQAQAYFEAAKDGAFVVRQTKIIRELETDKQILQSQLVVLQNEITTLRGQGSGFNQPPSYAQPQYQPPQPVFDINAMKAELMASLKAEMSVAPKVSKGWPKGKPRGKKVLNVSEGETSNE